LGGGFGVHAGILGPGDDLVSDILRLFQSRRMSRSLGLDQPSRIGFNARTRINSFGRASSVNKRKRRLLLSLSAVFAVAIAVGMSGGFPAANAQGGSAKGKAVAEQHKSAEHKEAKPAWISRCASVSRKTVPQCAIEQTAVLTKTGQLMASVTVRIPANSTKPVMMIHVPVGLYLPAGISLQVDDLPQTHFTVQTCDVKGCYAGDELPDKLLNAMKSGKKLLVIFQNLQKKNISVPLTLADFDDAYKRIQ
jgi:invasion protein IalB